MTNSLYPFFSFLPAFMKLLFLLFLVLLVYNRKIIWNAFKEIDKKTWLLLFLIVLTALVLRFFWIPHEQIVFYDGPNWVSQAFSIQEDNIYGLCEFVSGQSCHHYSFHAAWPPAYHTLLSVVFEVFGSSETVAFYFSSFLGTLSVFLVFLLSYLWTKKENVALISALVFSFLPVFLKFSGGVSLSLFSVFSLILTLIFFEIFLKNKEKSVFLLFLACLLCTIYIRAENIFFVPLFSLIFWLRGDFKFFWEKKNRSFFLISFLYFFLLLIPALFLIYIAKNMIDYEGWNPSLIETANSFLNKSPGNLYFFINYLINPFLFVLFGALGMAFTFTKEKKAFFFFFLFFLFYFIVYTSFHDGFFSGSLIRRSLPLYVPLLYFFAKGMLCFLDNIKEKFKKPAVFVFILVFTLSLIPTIPYIFEKEPIKITRDLLVASENKIPEDAYFVSSSSAIVRSAIKRNVVILPIFKQENEYFRDKEVFLFKDDIWWRRKNDYLQQFKDFIYENYDLDPIETAEFDNVYKFGVYRLVKK